jgi:hypothetical protein
MRYQSRLLIVLLLVSAGFIASVQAQEAVNDGNWSAASTWSGGQIPQAGDKVTIADDVDVVLDTSPPALDGLTINGKLSFSDEADLELTTEWIMVFGELEIGTEAKPHTRKATITLTDHNPGEQLMGMGDRGIMMSGGTLNLHGNRTHTWTRLRETAEAGETQIRVLDASGWEVGDQIVLASTDFEPRQAETRYITRIRGNRITLEEPLQYMHFGEITFGVDERGEVGLLTRNIKVQSSEDSLETYFGGHIMAMVTSKMYVEGVELNRMGQHMELARYPIHWHLVGEGGEGQYIKNAAIHDTFNRCVTVHGTNKLRVENNVTYNTVGHCFFMEDGIETGNEFIKNLAIQTKCHPTMECVPTNLAANGENNYEYENRMAVRQISFGGQHTLLPSDNTVASFWITNPDNTYIDNVAAGSDEVGFWYSLPVHPNGAFLGSEDSLNTWPQRTAIREFRGNVAHSNFDGFMLDRNINEDNTFGLAGPSHQPRENPADPNSPPVISYLEDFTAYKNRNGGVWGRGENHLFRNMTLADNAIGFTHSAGSAGKDPFSSLVVDSLFVGETDNIGNPGTSAEIAAGRSLPKPPIPDFPIRGYEYYDYRDDVVNTTFMNFEDNETRGSGALSWLLFTSSGVYTENTIMGAEFIDAKPVYFPHIDKRFDNDNRGGVAYRTAVIHDLDGSVGGTPDAYILIHDGENDSVATDTEACEIQPTWNAAVCTGDIGRLFFNEPNSGFPGLAAGLPITITRNGKDHKITANQSNVRSGTQMRVNTDREELYLSVREMDQNAWVIFELPGFDHAVSGIEQDSMKDLRNASLTSWYKDRDSVWVKLVVSDVHYPGPVLEPVGRLVAQTTIKVIR